MSKTIYIVIAIIAVLAVAGLIWWGTSQKTQAPAVPGGQFNSAADTTADINKDLDNIDVGDLNAEFKDVDEALNSL